MDVLAARIDKPGAAADDARRPLARGILQRAVAAAFVTATAEHTVPSSTIGTPVPLRGRSRLVTAEAHPYNPGMRLPRLGSFASSSSR